jgi:AraC-like DNA-binding protein
MKPSIRQRNNILEAARLDWFGFRIAGIRARCYFYYKHVLDEDYTVGKHIHDHWEVSRPINGSATYLIDGEPDLKTVSPQNDQFIAIPPKLSHQWKLTSSPLLLNSWQLELEAENDDGAKTIASFAESALARDHLIPASDIQVRTEQLLWDLIEEKAPLSVLGPMINGVARIVIGSFFQGLPSPNLAFAEMTPDQNASKVFAQKLRDFLETNLHHNLTMVDLESHFHYSGRHLNRIFRSHEKTSIGQYLRDRRFELAKRWLATTNRSVKDIGFSLGFRNASHFCRAFREQAGQSPMAYRTSAIQRVEKRTKIHQSDS